MKSKRRFMHGKRRRRRSPINMLIQPAIQNDMLDVKPIDSSKNVITGSAPTTGGLGLAIESTKKVFEGYGTTNKQIIKDARTMPLKI